MEVELAERDEAITVARLRGRLDANGAEVIGLRLTAGVVAKAKPAVLDLSSVSFMSSMGIRLLISCAKGLHGKGCAMAVFGAQPAVQEMFEQSGLIDILNVAPDEEHALARLKG